MHLEAAPGARTGGEGPVLQVDALPHPRQSVPPAVARRPRATPVVGDEQLDRRVAVAQHHVDARHRPGVLDHVGQGLLCEAVERDVERRVQRARHALHRQAGGEPGARDLGDERVQLGRARLRRQRRAARVLRAQDAEQAAHLREGVPPGVPDRAQRLGGGLRALPGGRRRTVRLHDDHRERVRDDVVQLTRDPRALDRRADRGLLVALERQQPVALLERGELGTARAPPGAERRRQQHRDHGRRGDLQPGDAVAGGLPAHGAQQRADDGACRPGDADARPGPVRDQRVQRDQRDDVARRGAVQHRELDEAEHADGREDRHGRAAAERHAGDQGDREREPDRHVAVRGELARQHEDQEEHARQAGIARHRARVVPAREPRHHPSEDRHAAPSGAGRSTRSSRLSTTGPCPAARTGRTVGGP